MRLENMAAKRIRVVLGILMESPLYFDMPIRERYELLRHTLDRL